LPLFTNLFSITFLYFFIISSLFHYLNLFVSIFMQSYVNNNLHVSTLYLILIIHKAWNSAGLKFVPLLASSTFIPPYFHYVIQTRTCIHSYKTHLFASFRPCFCFVHTIAQFSRILRFSNIYCLRWQKWRTTEFRMHSLNDKVKKVPNIYYFGAIFWNHDQEKKKLPVHRYISFSHRLLMITTNLIKYFTM
jgi:hypothetical protein